MKCSRWLVGFAAAMTAACGGGGGSNPTSPSPTSGPPTITITASGVSPDILRIDVGQQVQLVNNANRNVQISSDPHPTHQFCPPLNQAAMIAPGQTAMTAPFTQRGTCTYHDHGNPDNAAFRGSILVGVTAPGPAPDYRTAQ